MKKLISLLLFVAFIFAFASCGKKEDPNHTLSSSVSVGYLQGTTGLGMAKLIADVAADEDANITFRKFDSPALIMAAVANGSIDFACLPTNAFPKFYSEMNQSIQLAAINTLGVLYLATNGVSVSSLADLSGKTVYVPEAAPKLVLSYLLELYEVEDVTIKMEYDLDTLPSAVASGNVSIALLPEPKLTVASSLAAKAGKTLTVALDLSALWSARSDEPLVQGALLVSSEFAKENPTAVNEFLKLYRDSIEFMMDPDNLDAAAEHAVNAGILANAAVAKSAIPRCNLAFIAGTEMKTAAEGFFKALKIAVPTGNWYYVEN